MVICSSRLWMSATGTSTHRSDSGRLRRYSAGQESSKGNGEACTAAVPSDPPPAANNATAGRAVNCVVQACVYAMCECVRVCA